jgi:hypothetical protein
MRATVLRPIPAGNRTLRTGEVVDTSHWPANRLRILLEHRYVALAQEAPRDQRSRGDK